ncbi:MAG TPA: holo-[acyl-carrier-protein] synthase, partial [Methylophilaceae bacterium]|nr:holo-[acyl-carrier-protein] synthase [Methylophilaceae bacterium]
MIFGIGTDIVEVARIEHSLTQFGDDFAKRILAESELASYIDSKIKARFLAKRFAAKEAFSKA